MKRTFAAFLAMGVTGGAALAQDRDVLALARGGDERGGRRQPPRGEGDEHGHRELQPVCVGQGSGQQRPAGEAVDQLAGRDPELDLVVARPLHVARDREQLGPAVVGLAHLQERLAAVAHGLGMSPNVVSLLSALLIILFRGSVNALIPLYCVGVFLSFTLSQAGMVRRWLRFCAVTTTSSTSALAEFVLAATD